ncbi:MAG TPA: VacJ family lipoprotein [Rhizomicrobium sp.]|nr:VacJ family lipoprotein [Rhizomicrobium sp.]
MKNILSTLAALSLAVGLSACATTDPNGQNDPYEQTNRQIFDFDQKIDHAVARPVAVFYNHAVPQIARDGIHNVLANLDSPVIFANDILQGETTRGGQTLGRAVVNSTLGLGGLVDFAAKIGIPPHDEDFGQTLAVWGADEGPYLVLPFAGPSNPRDLVGMGGDIAMDPFTWARFHGSKTFSFVRAGVGVLDLRARNVDNLDEIERTSVDLYATTRSLYRQHRNAEIRNGAPDTENLPNL